MNSIDDQPACITCPPCCTAALTLPASLVHPAPPAPQVCKPLHHTLKAAVSFHFNYATPSREHAVAAPPVPRPDRHRRKVGRLCRGRELSQVWELRAATCGQRHMDSTAPSTPAAMQAVVNLADVIAKHRTSRGAKMAAAGCVYGACAA